MRLVALFLCLSVLAGFPPALAQAADVREKLSAIVQFDSITLHNTNSDSNPDKPVPEEALLEKGKLLALKYEYTIILEQCGDILPNTRYYLEVFPHLVLPDLPEGSPLTTESDETTEEFGKIFANGNDAWMEFLPLPDAPTKTILSEYGALENAYFYLNCLRADEVPAGPPLSTDTATFT